MADTRSKIHRLRNSISPFKSRNAVYGLGKTTTGDMLVLIRWDDRKVAVPFSQLTAIQENESTGQAIADWEVLDSARLPHLNLAARDSQ